MRKDKITYDFYYNEFCGGKGAELSLDAFDTYVGRKTPFSPPSARLQRYFITTTARMVFPPKILTATV